MGDYEIAALSVAGVGKEQSEDKILIGDEIVSAEDLSYSCRKAPPFYAAVCDGIKRHNGLKAAEIVAGQFSKNQRLSIKCNAKTAQRLLETQGAETPGGRMGTTLSGIRIGSGRHEVFNCGDSAVYRLSHGRLEQLTSLHNTVWELINNPFIRKEFRERVANLRNAPLTRYMGGGSTGVPDIISVDDLKPDELFVICTDGLYKYLDKSEIEGVLNAGGSLVDKARECVRLAQDAGSTDDISVVLVAAN